MSIWSFFTKKESPELEKAVEDLHKTLDYNLEATKDVQKKMDEVSDANLKVTRTAKQALEILQRIENEL